MAAIESDGIGQVEYDPSEVYWFESGIPAFEHLRRWLLVERARFHPLAVLQSIEQPRLRFACLPVRMVRADYQVSLGAPERQVLRCETEEGTRMEDPSLICLAIVTFRAGQSATANLLAPVVLNPRARLGAQIVQAGTEYSTEFELGRRGEEEKREAPERC